MNLYVIRITVVATLGGLLFGYDTAVVSGTVNYLEAYFGLSEMMLGFVVSSAIAGCMIGAAVSGIISDAIGRKQALKIAALCFLVSAIGTALPETVTQLILFRLLGGIGVGIAAVVSPLYIAEVAPERMRGGLVSLNQMAILAGMLIVYSVNTFIAGGNDMDTNIETGWRWMFGSEAIPATLFLMLLFTIPESPRWLLGKERASESRNVLERLYLPKHVAVVENEIREALDQEEGGWREVFSGTYRYALIIGTLLAVIQHGTGINAVMYYAPRIFTNAGIETTSAIGHMIMISLIMLAFTAIGLALVDKLGRKPLLLLSTAVMAASLIALYFDYMPDAEDFSETRVLVWVVAYVAGFSIGMGPVIWVMISEIFPNRVRGRCASIAVFFMWSASFLISQFFPSLLGAIGEGVFLLFGVLCCASLVFMAFFVPETKRLTLEEIEHTWVNRGR